MVGLTRLDKLSGDTLRARNRQVPLVGVEFGSSVPGRVFGPASPGQLRRDLEAVGLIVGMLAVLLGVVVGLGVATT